jgi:hypothetical protein
VCGAATTQQSIVIVVIRMVQPFRFRMKTLNGQRVTDVRVFDILFLTYSGGECRGTLKTRLYLTTQLTRHKTTRRNENDSR